ncbi:MAG: B12-binding domain-containing radical SAM protein [Deltaproteobacteria bacterium]|nr:B12-binding domain-containing radical SAM protein [Deltaproteobacteria bacterium]
MKVVFVFFNFDCPVGLSHGLAVLSRELKQAGHGVELVHISEVLGRPYEKRAVAQDVLSRSPDLVGFSFGSNHAWAARELAHEISLRSPGLPIVCGGIHSTILPEEVVRWPGVTAVAVGEADNGRFVELVDDFEHGRLQPDMPGFWFNLDKKIVANTIGLPVDLSSGSHRMDVELFDHNAILDAKRGYADAISGRGCPFRCSYCHNEPMRKIMTQAMGGKRPPMVRKRPVQEVLLELQEYSAVGGDKIRVFSFTDDVFPSNMTWTKSFLQGYREKFDLPLVFCAAPSQVTDELAAAADDAGTYMVRIGVESGSDRIRMNVLNRSFSEKTIVRAVRSLQEHGVNVLTFFMTAIPGEKERDVWDTFRFAADLRPDALQFSVFWPYPKTRLHEEVVRRGLIEKGMDLAGNYLSVSPLKWPGKQQVLYDRLRVIYDIAVNSWFSFGRPFKALLDKAIEMPDEEWHSGGLGRVRDRAGILVGEMLAGGREMYAAPFPDRPDVLLLLGRKRKRDLINAPQV